MSSILVLFCVGKLHLDFHSVGELHLRFCLCWRAPFAFFVCVESSILVLVSVGKLHLGFHSVNERYLGGFLCGRAPFGFSHCGRALFRFCYVWVSSFWILVV